MKPMLTKYLDEFAPIRSPETIELIRQQMAIAADPEMKALLRADSYPDTQRRK